MWRLVEGDVRAGLAQLPNQRAHCIVTSPPYWGLRAYGTEPQVWDGDPDCLHEWGGIERGRRKDLLPADLTSSTSRTGVDERQNGAATNGGQFCWRCGAWRGELGLEPDLDLWVSHIVGIFRAVRRVLRDDGTLWLNIGDAYTGSGKGQMGDGSASDRRGAKQATSAGTTTGGLPMGTAYNLPAKSLLMLPARLALALQADGWLLRSDIIWAKPAPMPESVSDRPTIAHEHIFLFAKQGHYFFDADAVRDPLESKPQRRLTPKRMGKGEYRQNSEFLLPEPGVIGNPFGRNIRNVWTIGPEPQSVEHYASYPTELARRCVAAGTSEHGCCAECGAPWRRLVADPVPVAGRGSGNKARKLAGAAGNDRLSTHMGSSVPWQPTSRATIGWQPSCDCDAPTVPATVLDPFAGTATTGVAALHLGRSFIGLELKPAYVRMAERRLSHTVAIVAPEHVAESDSPQQVRMTL